MAPTSMPEVAAREKTGPGCQLKGEREVVALVAWAAGPLVGLRDGGTGDRVRPFGLNGEGAGQAERAKKRGGREREILFIFIFRVLQIHFQKSFECLLRFDQNQSSQK